MGAAARPASTWSQRRRRRRHSTGPAARLGAKPVAAGPQGIRAGQSHDFDYFGFLDGHVDTHRDRHPRDKLAPGCSSTGSIQPAR